MNRYGVIMAGGGGTRFWPLSRKKTPKQLLNLTGKELMINEAVDRLGYVVDKSNIFIVTNHTQVESMREVTAGRIIEDHILSEPAARNTAACIGYAAVEIIQKYGDGIMIITPSDHFIKDNVSFINVLNDAIDVAEKTNELVTIGINPTFPATGFGYIKYKKNVSKNKLVLEFREKPDENTATKYINSGDYVWNSGMFVWKASVILEKFKEFTPDIYKDLIEISDSLLTDKDVIEDIYPQIRNISIDYAILEPSASKGCVYVVPGEFGWNDVGSWDMMDVLHNQDTNGNVSLGDTITIDTFNSVVFSSKKMIATVGVNDLVIVETEDAILVCTKEKAQDVKKIVDELNLKNRKELL